MNGRPQPEGEPWTFARVLMAVALVLALAGFLAAVVLY